jgi:hypothetical protein
MSVATPPDSPGTFVIEGSPADEFRRVDGRIFRMCCKERRHEADRIDSRSTSTGVMLQTYRPAGRATFGRADAGE